MLDNHNQLICSAYEISNDILNQVKSFSTNITSSTVQNAILQHIGIHPTQLKKIHRRYANSQQDKKSYRDKLNGSGMCSDSTVVQYDIECLRTWSIKMKEEKEWLNRMRVKFQLMHRSLQLLINEVRSMVYKPINECWVPSFHSTHYFYYKQFRKQQQQVQNEVLEETTLTACTSFDLMLDWIKNLEFLKEELVEDHLTALNTTRVIFPFYCHLVSFYTRPRTS